jgi:hypothetical protein
VEPEFSENVVDCLERFCVEEEKWVVAYRLRRCILEVVPSLEGLLRSQVGCLLRVDSP